MKNLPIGTKSVLFGVHCFFIHPIFVARGWISLYGVPKDPRIWVAFFVHDLGYLGKPNMDGSEGEEHVRLGANIMHRLFDRPCFISSLTNWRYGWRGKDYWHDFSLYHSRFYAKRDGKPVSELCYADKLVTTLEPAWLYLPRAKASGELVEYMSISGDKESKYRDMGIDVSSPRAWYRTFNTYIKKWVEEHKDGREDTWTPKT